MDIEKLSGLEKAAIVLVSMGDQFAAEIFKKLDKEEIRRVGVAMQRLGKVNADTVDALLGDFLDSLESDVGPMIGGDKAARRAMQLALGDDGAAGLIQDLDKARDPAPFAKVKNVDSKTMASFIKNEHPQTIAVILAHLPQVKAAEVVREFPENLQYEVVQRISNLDMIPPGIIEEIDIVLQREMLATEGMDTSVLGGVDAVAELLNNVDKATEEHIFSRLEEDDPELADQIRQLMFVFDDLISVDDRGIRTLLKEVRNEDLTVALKTASDDLGNKILSNVSERAAAMIREDLEVMGPMRLSEVEEAQQKIIQVARRLEKEGKIVIGGKGGEDVLV